MSDTNCTEKDDAHAADNVTSPNRNSLTEHTATINPNPNTTVTQHSDSYSSSLRGYVYVFPANVRGSSLRTDTTTSDLIIRPSIDSVDDDEDNRVEAKEQALTMLYPVKDAVKIPTSGSPTPHQWKSFATDTLQPLLSSASTLLSQQKKL